MNDIHGTPIRNEVEGALAKKSVDWKQIQSSTKALLTMPYVAGLFFPEGINCAVNSMFPPAPLSEEVARQINRQAAMLPCREIACRFPGLFSIVNAGQACQCPLKNICGGIRVSTIRLESHGRALGDIMLFAKGAIPVSSQEYMRVKTQVQNLADQLWNMCNHD